MSNLPNDSDSRQLASLRAAFKISRTDKSQRATPYRLGIYSGLSGMRINDFGSHSGRWVRAFVAGRHVGLISTQAEPSPSR